MSDVQENWGCPGPSRGRPDDLDATYASFHDAGTSVEWWPAEPGYWFVFGYNEVVAAAKDDQLFSSRHDLPNGLSPYTGVLLPPTPVEAIPIELDPPEHSIYRRLLTPRFTPAALRKREPALKELINSCIDAHIETGAIDLFHDLAKVVPAITTLRLMGVSTADVVRIADAVHIRGESRFLLNDAWSRLVENIMEVIIERREDPQDDLISDLIGATVRGRPIPDTDIVKICLTFVIGGFSTTAKVTFGALRYLGVDTAMRASLIEEPGLIPNAVEEFLRVFSPVPFLGRTATKTVLLGGQSINRGDRVVLGWGAANRDPEVFADPDEIRPDRSPNPHVALGHGAHYCIGAGLGRAETRIMLEQVLERIPDYRLVAEHETIGYMSGPPQPLEAVFDPRPRPAIGV